MRIGLDISGGDFAPESTLNSLSLVLPELAADDQLVLFGEESFIQDFLARNNLSDDRLVVVHAPEIIEMNDSPTKAFQQKKASSIVLGFDWLRKGKIDGFASAGNSGAMMVGSVYAINTIPGVIRPSSAVMIPKLDGGNNVMLDVGTNPDAKPDVLFQYGLLGSLYAEHVLGIEHPRIGLLNIGSEEKKGNLLVQSAYQLMKDATEYNFIGNVEGRDLFNDKADVVITDGFTGNVVIKQIQAMYRLMEKRLLLDDYFSRFNYENHGGSPIIGINSAVVIGHGISSPLAIKNMMLLLREVSASGLHLKIKHAIANYGL
ncbi:MAG: phosphate acyltransferase [Bacteroidetes bacterium]|nr:phosphate acyltransferase [Bacteroidota bacterium]MBU1580447.1 phosphate acyltransferase [Bacteroidota bacterium]MBU2466329.1 phosphate acyltransferase [Bacteroidota bacterium]MBU2557106.1 phosphate acyltransferase [Bacteroidota bacterium]